ncbi:TPA: glycosyltransferase family 4 protein [Klebsiella quasipneumoniae]|uniref:glycosyltransferase family 4 protein n=1 Tax=Enterobacter cloacae complex TaxID=354276 RepID=UPI0014329562|nr:MULTISPECIES: glycosyltransferase family 4 protein [Enterobacter cloacae complex]NKD22843.1 glycosyltransferase [Enterobacter asburiae]BDS19124.1 glycosyl transferase family 1 [Enterobacter roggenkampii]BDS22408.1 glycosyl transferase family 1 [Enterobacter roggenkampii]HBQ8794616.1 glycosyltransferase family 4 protein [Klebsiella quasipneumoniae]
MRILHFFKTYYPVAFGGVQQVIYQLAEGACRNGAEVDVLSLTEEKTAHVGKIGYHNVHTSKQDLYIASTGFSLSAFKDFRRLAEQADVIHYHFPWPYMDLVHFMVRPDKPTVVTYHSDIVKQKNLLRLYQPLMRRFLNDVDAVVASSPNYVQTSPVLQSLKRPVDVIPFGLDDSSYPKAPVSVTDKWQALLRGRFFLFIGFLRYYKGLSYLLDAIAGLDYPLVIIGEGPCEQELKEQAERLKLKNIHFVGAVSDEDKCALLELCYSVVFPSHLRSEAFGMTLLEAAMYGKPMISCEIGTGTTFINLHKETGLVVKPTDPVSLRAALVELWENPCATSQMGQNAKARFDHMFTAERMVESYMSLYKKVIAEHPQK